MSDRFSIAIADDHKLVSDSLSEFLTQNLNCDIVLIARSGEELMEKFFNIPVDILLLDMKMSKMDGMEVLRLIRANKPDQKIIVLTMYNDAGMLKKMMELGVNAYLSKSGSGEELLRAIIAVRDKGHYYTKSLSESIYAKKVETGNVEEVYMRYPDLDEMDKKLLRMMCEELTSKEIADELKRSARSIEGRKRRLLDKIGAKSQAGLILFAIREGIFEIDAFD